MSDNVKNYGLLIVKGLAAAAFFAAGSAKLAGAPMMVDTFETVGLGQWFRYLTGAIEIGSSVLLFVPGKQAYGAALLVCTMIGAVLAHLFILGTSAVPALILGVFASFILFVHREQLPTGSKPNIS